MDQEDLSKWLKCVAAVVERCHDRVHYWEIDNEPKITANYAAVVIAASKVIKKIDPTAKVIAGSIARVNVAGIRMMLEEVGVGPYIDVITFHPYNEFPEGLKHNFLVPVSEGYQTTSPLVAEIFEILEKQDRKIELWQGECGYPLFGIHYQLERTRPLGRERAGQMTVASLPLRFLSRNPGKYLFPPA